MRTSLQGHDELARSLARLLMPRGFQWNRIFGGGGGKPEGAGTDLRGQRAVISLAQDLRGGGGGMPEGAGTDSLGLEGCYLFGTSRA